MSPLVKSAFYFHEITGCNGFEFIAISNIKFNDFIILPNNAILVPWFLIDTKGKSPDDPDVIQTRNMERNAQLVYDGWIEIDQWDEENVSRVIQSISESLSIFSVVFGDVFFSCTPKYSASRNAKPYHDLGKDEISTHHKLFHQINTMSESDRRAIYRSFSWLSHAKQMDSLPARFLFLFLAIEALAKYIEDDAEDDSCFISLRSSVKKTKKERQEWRDNCIKEQMVNFEKDPPETIKIMYFNCIIGVKALITRHLEFVLPNDISKIKLIFEEKIDEKTLYELRNDIAHGSLDLLTDNQVNRLKNRLGEVEEIANRYVLTVLKKCLGIEFPNEINNTVIFSHLDMLQRNHDNKQTPPNQ